VNLIKVRNLLTANLFYRRKNTHTYTIHRGSRDILVYYDLILACRGKDEHM